MLYLKGTRAAKSNHELFQWTFYCHGVIQIYVYRKGINLLHNTKSIFMHSIF